MEHRRVRLLPAAQALEPVGHVREVVIADEGRRDGLIAGQRDVFLHALNAGIVLMSPFLFNAFPTRTSFASDVDQGRRFPHDPREAVAIVAEARGVAHQATFRILQQRLEGVRILAPVFPGEDAAVSDHRPGERVIQKVVDQVDTVAHPLIGDAAGEIFVEAEFEIHPGIEGPIRLGEQPAAPIRILLPNLLDLRPATPAWPVIVPHNLDLADLAERPGLDQVSRGDLVGLTAVLGPYLDNQVPLQHRVPGSLGFVQVIGHRLLAIAILAGLGHEFQMSRVLEIGGGKQHRIHVFERQQLLHVLEGSRRSPVCLLCPRGGRFAVDFPQVAHSSHLDVLCLQLGDKRSQALTAPAHSDVPERDAVVRAQNAAVGQGGASESACARDD